jgi:hypothetical protein
MCFCSADGFTINKPADKFKRMGRELKKYADFPPKKMQFWYCSSSSFVGFMENCKSHYISLPVVPEKLPRLYEK